MKNSADKTSYSEELNKLQAVIDSLEPKLQEKLLLLLLGAVYANQLTNTA